MTRPLRLAIVLVSLFGNGTWLGAQNVQLGLRVPAGFEITEFADGSLANDIHNMTLDPAGRVVVSGPGYIRILVNERNLGRAERAIDIIGAPKDGAQGMLWEGSSLYFTGDGGLRCYHHLDKQGRPDGPSKVIRALRTGGEHTAHAVRRGPDDWLYVLCGNSTGIDQSFAQLPTSPVQNPVAGCVVRFTPDLKASEIVADGFRNPYDMDFNVDGELFTFDSDNERCVSLPWYESTRFYHVMPGSHYGWESPQRTQTWRLPPYFCDVVAPVAHMGRGSPTGVACYRHVQFPPHYRKGMFLLDWTFGRVYFVSLQRSGSSYTCEKEVFLQSVGDNGFAPTAIVVHPVTGDLYIAIGGRGSRGAVYRVRYPQGRNSIKPAEVARLLIKPRSLDWQKDTRARSIAQAGSDDALERVRGLAAIDRHRTQYSMHERQEIIRKNWDHPDRYVRKSAADQIAGLSQRERQTLVSYSRTVLEQTTLCQGSYQTDREAVLAKASQLLADRSTLPEARLANVRLIQLALGGIMSPKARGTVWEGYSPGQDPLPSENFERNTYEKALHILVDTFPTGDSDLDREITRTLALVKNNDPAFLSKIAELFTDTSDPVADLHYLIVIARLAGPRSPRVTKQVAGAMLGLDRKLVSRHENRDTNWPLRVAELHAELARKDLALNGVLLDSADFGRPDHALFAQCPGFNRLRAAQIFLDRAARDESFPWNATLVELIGNLPEKQAVPILRQLWNKAGLDEPILNVLSRHPRLADREKFLEGLRSPRLATMRLCLDALQILPPSTDGSHILPLIRLLQRLPEGRAEDQVRERLVKYLQRATGEKQLGRDKHVWAEWFVRIYPEQAARLFGEGIDVAAWNHRLEKIAWSAGNVGRGRQVFTRASCAACHSGPQALGPDLQGVTGRFSRADLFTAILQPSLNVSSRYRTTMVVTADDRIYQGIVIYEAVDSLMLQTGAATTVRLVNNQIASRRVMDNSLMPSGLLDKLPDKDIADLYAFLRSMGGSARIRN